jgi:hypothetical protein
MAAEARRHRKQMLGIVAAVGLAMALTVGVLLDRALSANRAIGGSSTSSATAAPQQQQQPPPQQPPQAGVSAPNGTTNNTPAGGIDPEVVQRALAQLTQTQRSGQGNPPAQQLPAPSVLPTGSDRYPGSQPVNVDTSGIPDIGIPVSSEVYTTSDPVPTVVSYYRKRYPDARVTEINGQQIIAVDRPGAIKVIAIGSNGQETRIAIVQPGN